METTLEATWTVEQVMQAYPQTVSVFLALKTDCVGCSLERFCSLEEVVSSYELSLEVVLKKLHESIYISSKRGE